MAARCRPFGAQHPPLDCCNLSRLPAYLFTTVEELYGLIYLSTARCLDQLCLIARDAEEEVEHGGRGRVNLHLSKTAKRSFEGAADEDDHRHARPEPQRSKEELKARRALLRERCRLLKAVHRKRPAHRRRPLSLQAHQVLVIVSTAVLLLLHAFAFEPNCLFCAGASTTSEDSEKGGKISSPSTSLPNVSAATSAADIVVQYAANVTSSSSSSSSISNLPCTAPCSPETLTTWRALLSTSLTLYSHLLLSLLTLSRLHSKPPTLSGSITAVTSLLLLLLWSTVFEYLQDKEETDDHHLIFFIYRLPGSSSALLSLRSSPHGVLAITTLYGLLLLSYLLREHAHASLQVPREDPWIGWALARREQQLWEVVIKEEEGAISALESSSNDLFERQWPFEGDNQSRVVINCDEEEEEEFVDRKTAPPICDLFGEGETAESWV